MASPIIGIYKITNLINGKVYIGQSWDIEQRWKQYKGGHAHSCHLNRSFKKYGLGYFKFEVVRKLKETGDTQSRLDKWECYYIKKYDSMDSTKGYNKKDGGANGKPNEETRAKIREAGVGRIVSEETRLKIGRKHKGKVVSEYTKQLLSKKNSGRNHPGYGKHPSEKTLRLLSKAKRGKNHPMYGACFSEEHRQKISEGLTGEKNGMYGRHHSRSTRKKIAETRIGKYVGAMNPVAKAVKCIETGKVFCTVTRAAIVMAMSTSNISSACRGYSKTAGGFHWEYVTQAKGKK